MSETAIASTPPAVPQTIVAAVAPTQKASKPVSDVPLGVTTAAVPEPSSAPETSIGPDQPSSLHNSTLQISASNPDPELVGTSAMSASAPATVDRAEEPQSTLTKQFTEPEWEALVKFREQLPEIFADAYPDNPKAREQSVVFWGVTIDPTNPKNDSRVSVILMKFLRARNLSITEARQMLVNTLRWRESFNIEAAMKEAYPEDVFGNLGHNFGHDKGGRPVAYNVFGGNLDIQAVFGDVQRFIRWRVALMEKSIALLDFVEVDQMLQIHDYAGVSITSRDANSKAAAAEATNIFQSHYPELLYKKFFINIPTLLNWIFWAFKPLLSANTLAKMTVVGTGHHANRKALLPFIDEQELPKRYGGEAKAF